MSQDFSSAQSANFAHQNALSDTVMNETVPVMDVEAFHADLPSLASHAGKWVVYYQGHRLGIFSTYTDALFKGWEVAGERPFFVEQIHRSRYAAFLARLGF
jgi:hypothetical protein